MSSQDGTPPPSAVVEPTPLGRVALGLGVAAVSCAVVAGLCVTAPSMGWLLAVVCVLLGIAGVVVAVVAIVKGQARRAAIIGLILGVLAGPLAFLTAFVAVMVMLMTASGVSG